MTELAAENVKADAATISDHANAHESSAWHSEAVFGETCVENEIKSEGERERESLRKVKYMAVLVASPLVRR